MVQRLLAFLMLSCLLAPGVALAEADKTRSVNPPPPVIPPKTAEERFLEGMACLKQSDATCAQIKLASINPSSPYAKILEARLAASREDFDTVLRLLIPLHEEGGLLPSAHASLHATLALAYENRGNLLRAIEHRCRAESFMTEQEEIDANQTHIWHTLATLPKETLLEMRGESPDTVVQGWIDLALELAHTGQKNRAMAQWRNVYPDHPASDKLLQSLANAPSERSDSPAMAGKVALLLPLEIPAFATAAHAVQAGFMAAARTNQGHSQVQVYTTPGDRESVAMVYRRAVEEGASYVVGPLTREEVVALNNPGLITVPTVVLNTPQLDAPPPQKLILFGLPVEEEARQLANFARAQGMRTAIVIAANTLLANRIAQAFADEWMALDGTITEQHRFSADTNLAELKAHFATHPADMILLAANVEQARAVRPYLDPATPTYGLSHLYDGDPNNPLNDKLSTVHFVDMPWLLNPADPAYSAYRQAAAALPPGEAQRWFAVGVDAWYILFAQAQGTAAGLQRLGLSGKLTLHGNRVMRELPLAQFRANEVFLEQMP